MKLVPVEIKYTCGTTIYDRVSLNVQTCEVHFAPRLTRILKEMENTEPSPVITIEIGQRTFPITRDDNGRHVVLAHAKQSVKPCVFRSITTPNRAQRHLNGRLVHLLSGASLAAAVVSAYSVTTWNASSAAGVVSYFVSAMLLGAVGFYCKMDG